MMSNSFAERLRPLLPELVAAYGTPFHLYDEAGFLQTHRALVEAFGPVPFTQYFAVKALPNPHVLDALRRAGSGLDCSSPAELMLAEAIGAGGEEIVFTSNNTAPAEYERAQRMGALVIFDDRTMFERIDPPPGTAAFRVAPHGLAAGSRLMGDATASKFGVPVDELVEVYALAKARGATRFGIHGMACANELDAGRAGQAVYDLMEQARRISDATGITLDFVNIGGGLGIPYRPDDQPFDLGNYARSVIAARARFFGEHAGPRILMECGRYVTGPHGVLVTRVVNRCRKAREVVGLDASMSALMRPAFYPQAYHHITLPFAEGRRDVDVDVVGALCENMDKFAVARALPDPRVGDIALIHDTGAHGHAMGFTYNGRLRPAELLLRTDASVVEIRRAETFADYLATVREQPRPVAVGAPERPGSAAEMVS